MDESTHKLRGHIVQRRTTEEIVTAAVEQFYIFKTKTSEANIEIFIDLLAEQNISVHILRNAEWQKKHTLLKKGESIPSQNKILLPKQLLDKALSGDRESFETFFHELGHVILKHEPTYQKTAIDYLVMPLDDAEEQADLFAKAMLILYEMEEEPKQLQFIF